jgi:hypothetical protein
MIPAEVRQPLHGKREGGILDACLPPSYPLTRPQPTTERITVQAKKTQEEITEERLNERFGSVIQLSVKVLRPLPTYPWERAVWDSEIRVPITESSEHVQSVISAWVKTMEAGIELATSFSTSKEEKPEKEAP